MEKIKITILLLAAIAAGILSSCTRELDLDENTRLLIDKQAKLEKLDELFDLAFEDPVRAETEYYQFVKNELVTESQNFLANQDVQWRNAMTDLAIRLNKNFEDVSGSLSTTSLFDLYKAKFQNEILNKSLIGDIPQQLRRGERFDRFKNKVEEISIYIDDKIDQFKASSPVDNSITDKRWQLLNHYAIDYTTFKIFIINFDFVLKADKNIDMNNFFLLPYIPKPGGMLADQDEGTLIEENLLSPLNYAVYGNKIFFYFHFKNTVNPLATGAAQGKLERHWYYEYEYKLEEEKLILEKPRMGYYMYPVLYGAESGQPLFDNVYMDGLKKFILTAQ